MTSRDGVWPQRWDHTPRTYLAESPGLEGRLAAMIMTAILNAIAN